MWSLSTCIWKFQKSDFEQLYIYIDEKNAMSMKFIQLLAVFLFEIPKNSVRLQRMKWKIFNFIKKKT